MKFLQYYSRKNNLIRLLTFAFATAFVTLFVNVQTPLWDACEGDCVIFFNIGQLWLDGHIPYLEAFDHKGPLLFLINAIGLALGIGRFGLWALAVVNAICALEIVYQCGRMLTKNTTLNFIGVAFSFVLLFGGDFRYNTCESWSMVFLLFPLWLCLKYLKSRLKNLGWAAFVTGLCFGAVAMIRINNNVTIVGICLTLLILLIKDKQYKQLLYCILAFFGGVICAVLPFVVYFAMHDGLYEMIYGTFLFNIQYLQTSLNEDTNALIIYKISCLLPGLALIIICLLRKETIGKRIALLYVLICIVSIATNAIGRGYRHYFIVMMPIYAGCAQLLYDLQWKQIIIILIAIFAAPISFHTITGRELVAKPYRYFGMGIYHRHWNEKCDAAVKALLTEEEMDSVYCVDPLIVYSLARKQHCPVGRYFQFQNGYVEFSPMIKKDILEQFETANPRIIMFYMHISTHMLEIIHPYHQYLQNYEVMEPYLIEKDSYIVVFRRKDTIEN